VHEGSLTILFLDYSKLILNFHCDIANVYYLHIDLGNSDSMVIYISDIVIDIHIIMTRMRV